MIKIEGAICCIWHDENAGYIYWQIYMRFHSVLVEVVLEFIPVMTNSHRAGINVNSASWAF